MILVHTNWHFRYNEVLGIKLMTIWGDLILRQYSGSFDLDFFFGGVLEFSLQMQIE